MHQDLYRSPGGLKRIGAGESNIFDLGGVNKKIWDIYSLYHCLFICPGYFSTEISTVMFLEFDAAIIQPKLV